MIDFVEQKYETKRTFPPQTLLVAWGNILKAKALQISRKSYDENTPLTRMGLYREIT